MTGSRLSACLLTAGPADRVVALLALLRPLADELVVALDDRAAAAAGAAIAAAADRTVSYSYREPVDRPLRWLFSLCSGDWILNLDDDEVPSAALVEALAELVAARDVTHYWLLRRWLWPDAQQSIAEHPWTTDWQLRLVRNDETVLRFPSETHRPLEAIGPGRYVRDALYHADLLLNPLERREAKAARYEALRPGKRVGGGPMNHVFHLPERRPGPATEPLPEADAELVRRLLEAPAPPAAPPVEIPAADDAEIERLWAGRGLDARGALVPLEQPLRLVAREQRTVDVLVRNLGDTVWPWGERAEPPVRVSYRFDGVDEEGIRTPLPADLRPGEEQVVPVHVRAPERPGRHVLRLDLVHEHVRWFGCEVPVDVEVLPRRRVAVAGGGEDVLAQLTDQAPEFEVVVLSSEPGPLVGHEHAPDLRRFLLDGTEAGRKSDLRVLALRTRELVAAARKLAHDEPERPLLRGGQEALEQLRAASHLLLPAGPAEPGTRELWLRLATVRAARELGAEVVIQEGALPAGAGPLDRLLEAAILRHARVVPAGTLGLR